jgi:hypothetical protein
MWLPDSAGLSVPGRFGNALQEGHKHQLFIIGANGVRLAI